MKALVRASCDLVFFLACLALYLTASFGVALAIVITALWQRLRKESRA